MRKLEITRAFWGTYRVKYDCPGCGARLRSPLADVGKDDTCPDCSKTFVVPGAEESAKLAGNIEAGVFAGGVSGFILPLSFLFLVIFFPLLIIYVLLIDDANSGSRSALPAIESTGDDSGTDTDADRDAAEVMRQIMSTSRGRSEVERIGGKDLALTEFQQANGISDRIAEAAIKEWVFTHGDFDWDLEDVKAICLRNKRSGIPYDYLPESEK